MFRTALLIPALWAFFIALELLRGRFRPAEGSRRETLLDLLSWAQAWFVVSPLVVLGSAALPAAFLPEHAGAWAGTVVFGGAARGLPARTRRGLGRHGLVEAGDRLPAA